MEGSSPRGFLGFLPRQLSKDLSPTLSVSIPEKQHLSTAGQRQGCGEGKLALLPPCFHWTLRTIQQALWLTFIKLSARNRRDREDAGARFVSAIIIPRGSCHCHL